MTLLLPSVRDSFHSVVYRFTLKPLVASIKIALPMCSILEGYGSQSFCVCVCVCVLACRVTLNCIFSDDGHLWALTLLIVSLSFDISRSDKK